MLKGNQRPGDEAPIKVTPEIVPAVGFSAAARADDEASRLEFAQRYAYVFPDLPLLRALCALGPIVEIGAGTGYWARRLKDLGSDIRAFDRAPPHGDTPNRYHAHTSTWTEVERGDHRVLTAHADRALFLCWPPLFSSLGDCLDFYAGSTVACIGDGGHQTARLRNLNSLFDLVAVYPARAVDPLPGQTATLSIWRRLAAD